MQKSSAQEKVLAGRLNCIELNCSCAHGHGFELQVGQIIVGEGVWVSGGWSYMPVTQNWLV